MELDPSRYTYGEPCSPRDISTQVTIASTDTNSSTDINSSQTKPPTMDEETMRTILESFTNKIKEDSDKKLDLIDSKLNTINTRLEETNIHLEEVTKKTETNAEDIKALQEESTKNTQDIFTNKSKLLMNDMRIRELEEELEKKNNSESNRLNQLYSTVGVLKAQISDLTNKPNSRPNPQQTNQKIQTFTSNFKPVVTKKNANKTVPDKVVTETVKTGPKNSSPKTQDMAVTVPTEDNPETTTAEDNSSNNTISEAKKVIGLYPVNRRDIAHWVLSDEEVRNISDDDIFRNEKYSDARTEAANDFLYSKLSLRIGEVDILKTKMSKNPYSAVLWVTLSKHNDVTKVFRRAAQLKTRDIRIMTFFPSSIWSRKMSVEKNMAKARQTTKDLKYQIRLGNNDIQLFIKDNQNPIWTRVDLDKFGPVTDLPEELKDNTNNRPDNTQANNSNKRKDITPNKTDAKKTKEDHEDINTTSDKQNDGDNDTEDDLAATASASMDTDIELVAKVIKNKNI